MTTALLSPYQINQQQVSVSNEGFFVEQAFYNGLKHYSSTITTETFSAKFERLKSTWKDATRFTSSYNQLLSNPAYLQLIAMGEKVLPYIFNEMKKEPDHWFPALHILTAINPVNSGNMGNIKAMTQDWLTWGKEKGYVS